jgi:hypothetical protein
MGEFAKIADVNPIFTWSQFTRGVVYHFLFFFVTGPFTFILLLPIETMMYITTIGFLPTKASAVFFVIQTMTWLAIMVIGYYFISDRDGTFGTEENYLPVTPAVLVLVNIVIRMAVISTRHGTLPPTHYERMRTDYASIKVF